MLSAVETTGWCLSVDPSMSWLQADIFFYVVRRVVALKTMGTAGGGNVFSRQAERPMQPASRVVLITSSVRHTTSSLRLKHALVVATVKLQH
jgi:hypothetical protein